MMGRYFLAFLKANRIKTLLLLLSLSVYFSLLAAAYSLDRSIPALAAIPLRSIGVQTIVQKTGKIPAKMAGAIFPHSNAPIGPDELDELGGLEFVEETDWGLYFWYFDESYFKALLGVERESTIFADILKRNVLRGSFDLGGGGLLLTEDFARKRGLDVGGRIGIGTRSYEVRGILKPNLSGNIIPADIYLAMDDALAIVRNSAEMKRIYQFGQGRFGNVVLLHTDPGWQGDREEAVRKIDEKFIVFSEKTFSGEILAQLQLVSSAGRTMFAVLGLVVVIAFVLMIVFNLKTREKEIAVLRIIGWTVSDLKRHFMGETVVVLLAALTLGNALTCAGLSLLRRQTVSMELPWDISAKPHFLPEENSIERVVTSTIPVTWDPAAMLVISALFLLLFWVLSLALFSRIKKIKPIEYQG